MNLSATSEPLATAANLPTNTGLSGEMASQHISPEAWDLVDVQGCSQKLPRPRLVWLGRRIAVIESLFADSLWRRLVTLLLEELRDHHVR